MYVTDIANLKYNKKLSFFSYKNFKQVFLENIFLKLGKLITYSI